MARSAEGSTNIEYGIRGVRLMVARACPRTSPGSLASAIGCNFDLHMTEAVAAVNEVMERPSAEVGRY